MGEHATECSIPEESLSATQIQAIRHLISGESISSTAGSLGVNRATIHRWLKDDLAFRASLNRAKTELSESIDARLHQISSRALDTVQEALEDGDRKVAIAVLKGCGFLDGRRSDIGSTSEAILEVEDNENRELLSMRRAYSTEL